MTTENLKNTMITVDAMQQANKELKKQYKNINLDKARGLTLYEKRIALTVALTCFLD